MGSHHQFQDIQGLASQQPASADMVLLGFGGVASLGGLRSRTVLSRDGPGRAQKCRNPRDIGAFRGWLRVFSKASEASGTGCRRRAGPILASDFCMLALLQRLGEALRGAGVPTPHAALRHADVTLSPRRPRSCGQR